ncbi:restriction endonuclease subunit S [Providencia rettgeri]
MNVPKLRFDEFKTEWNQRKIEDIFTIFSGFAFKSSDAKSSGCRWLKIADVGCQTMTPNSPSFLPEAFLKKYPQFVITKNDYVIALTRPILNGKLKIANAGEKYHNSLLNQRVGKIVTQQNIMFIYSLLQMESMVLKINNAIAGTDPPNLSIHDIKEIIVFVPDIQEQNKIAFFLSSVDEKITLQNSKVKLLQQYKKGMIQKLFSQKIRFKDNNGVVFPKWTRQSISDIAEVNPKSKVLPEDFIYIDLESVQSGRLVQFKKMSKIDAPSRAQRLLKFDDVLFQLVRPYQKNNLHFKEQQVCVASTGYAQLRAKCNAAFLFQLLHLDDFTDQVMNRCTGTSYPAINSSDLASIQCEIPCLEEQRIIGNFLSSIDDKITLENTKLDKLKQWKQGLLQQMFV